jgi:hypothetical protein
MQSVTPLVTLTLPVLPMEHQASLRMLLAKELVNDSTGSCAVHSAIKLLPQEPAAKKEEVALITQAIQASTNSDVIKQLKKDYGIIIEETILEVPQVQLKKRRRRELTPREVRAEARARKKSKIE